MQCNSFSFVGDMHVSLTEIVLKVALNTIISNPLAMRIARTKKLLQNWVNSRRVSLMVKYFILKLCYFYFSQDFLIKMNIYL
jgi:hypothetical protein